MLIKDTLADLGDDVVMISIDGDPNENADLLRRYADQLGLEWRFAVAPPEVMASLADEYGNQYLFPPSEPMVVVSPSGEPAPLDHGRKDADTLRDAVRRARG